MQKTFPLFFLVCSMLGSAWAQQMDQGYHNNQANIPLSYAEKRSLECEAVFSARNPSVPSPVHNCDYFFYTAAVANSQINSSDQLTSSDRSVSCVQKAGYTVDYEACKSVLKLYNYTVIAEQAMQMQQSARQTITNNKISQDVSYQTYTGDGQTAAWDAAIKNNKNLAGLNKEQVAVYTAAVGALSSQIAKWPSKNDAGIRKLCSSGAFTTTVGQKANLNSSVKTGDCAAIVKQTINLDKSSVYANENAKMMFMAKATDFVAKGVKAGIDAAALMKNAKAMQALSDSYKNPESLVERCMLVPNDPSCINPDSGYQGSDFGSAPVFGDSGNTVFGGTDDTFGEAGNSTTFGNTVNDISAPFVDEAKEASSILDPASAASVAAGSPAAGGGGAGGGAGGGGGASLGNDLAGVDKEGKKEAEIKATKFAGGYSTNGGAGFQAVKGGQDEGNPLSGLFDNKAMGGVEEESRGIASVGIAGQDSGLFQKISNRYGVIQSEKRIEANNLE